MKALLLLALSILAIESADSIRSFYRRFLSAITQESLAAFCYACPYSKTDYSKLTSVTTSLVLEPIPDSLKSQPAFFCIGDTMISKLSRKFEGISELFGHVAHDGSNYLNGYYLVSLMLCVLIWSSRQIACLAIPLDYRMRQEKQSKLEFVAAMACQVMLSFAFRKNIIILCDNRYARKDLACIVDEYSNPGLICNARTDSIIYDLTPQPTGERDRPAKYGECLSIREDFTLPAEKIEDCYVGARRILTDIFGQREVLIYVASTEETGGSRRLFFSTIFPE